MENSICINNMIWERLDVQYVGQLRSRLETVDLLNATGRSVHVINKATYNHFLGRHTIALFIL